MDELTREDYLARAEALGKYYAKKRRPMDKFGWVNVLNDIEYHPIFGKGEDRWASELDFQAQLESKFIAAYQKEKYRLRLLEGTVTRKDRANRSKGVQCW